MTTRALLVHGLHSSPATWWRTEEWLRDAGWTTSTATLLGHGGRGPAADYRLGAYADDLDAAAPGPWDLVMAHSLGGSAAVVLAARRPEWTARLALLDPMLRVPDDDVGAVAAEQVAELDATGTSLRGEHPGWTDRDISTKLAAIGSVDPEAAIRTFASTTPWELAGRAATLRMPTLLLGGDPEVFTMLQPELAAELVAANERIDYRVIPAAGHSPHRDRPENTRDAVLGWLARA